MFDLLTPAVLVVLASVAVASVSCALLLVPRVLPKPAYDTNESWRDEAPGLFRWCRWAVRRFAPLMDQRLSRRRRAKLENRINEAGLAYAVKPEEVEVVRWQVCLVFTVISVYVAAADFLDALGAAMTFLVLLPLGYCYVDIWLADAAKKRKRSIEKHFPFFLDVVVLSMKAGLAFPAAIQQATMRLPEGPIKQELARLIREVRTGVSRRDGLERLAKRVRMASVSNFVAAVAQADESGGSLTASLNEQARQRRRERFQRAEKLANQAPVKMLFPLVACLFPVTFIIIGFPIMEQLRESGLFD